MDTKIIQPLWNHPTNVVLIDDDINLLESLVAKVDPNFPPTTFSDPKKALEYLKKNVLPLEKLSQTIISDIEPSEERHLSTENIAIDFAPLHAHLDKPDRFTKVLVVVVDRVMKEMDGLNLCRTIKQSGLPVKLILLTGQTETKEAVAAFNDHIIDAFVEKSADTANMMNQVNPHIKKLAFEAFCDGSAKLLGPISNRLPSLTHKTFANFLKTMCQEHNAIEHYLIDGSGSCLLITPEGLAKVLLIRSSNDFTNACDMVDTAEDTDLLEKLQNHRAFPFTGIEQSYFKCDVSKWKNAMVPMKKQADLDLYYGVIEIPQKVMSFDHYVNELWQPKPA